jgi:hypothetical protein
MRIPLPPPWVLLSLMLGMTKHVQNAKEIGSLGFALLTGRGEDAACQLCDKITGVILKEIEYACPRCHACPSAARRPTACVPRACAGSMT